MGFFKPIFFSRGKKHFPFYFYEDEVFCDMFLTSPHEAGAGALDQYNLGPAVPTRLGGL
jgi:hypothetical protein